MKFWRKSYLNMHTLSYHFSRSSLLCLWSPPHSVYEFGMSHFTIEAWIKTTHGGPVLVKGGDMKDFSLQINLLDTIFTIGNGNNSRFLRARIFVCDGRWHHIAAVSLESTGYIYLDGIQVPVQASSHSPLPIEVASGGNVTLGAVGPEAQQHQCFEGYMSEVRLWNVARSREEISVNMSDSLGPTKLTPDLVGYWPGEFGLAVDFSMTRNKTTIVGTNRGSNSSPPLTSPYPEDLAFMFHGLYRTTVACIGSSIYSDGPELALTSKGFLVLDGTTLINGVQLHGTVVTWPKLGNSSYGRIQFKLQDSRNTTTNPAHSPEYFEGEIATDPDYKPVSYKGHITPLVIGSGIILNIGTGLLLHCANPGENTVATLTTRAAGWHDRFYKDVGSLVHMASNLVLVPEIPNTKGSRIVITSNTDKSQHNWMFKKDGTILQKNNPSLALAASAQTSNTATGVITAKLNTEDSLQKWAALGNSQRIFNGAAENAVMTAIGMDDVGIRAMTGDDPTQLWYLFRSALICESRALALTVISPGKKLKLSRWSPGSSNQHFIIEFGLLKHISSGQIVISRGNTNNGDLYLGSESSKGPMSQWSLNSSVRLQTRLQTRSIDNTSLGGDLRPHIAQHTTTYTISVVTSDTLFAGTDDKVEISLQNGSEGVSLPRSELKHSTTHANPFERGNKDTFILKDMKNIGAIDSVTIFLGDNNWLWTNFWRIDYISVFHQSQKNPYYCIINDVIQSTNSFELIPFPEVSDCRMSLGKAPAQDSIGRLFGWDHTWISVVNTTPSSPTIKTWFDCAGGHGGPGAIEDVVTGLCTRQDVVLMSTGKNYDEIHPLQETYGTNLTNGKENANVRADGKLQWDGQCHQIANRYLWTCVPPTSIDEGLTDKMPHGYGLSVSAFGKYGVGFREWRKELGFRYQTASSDDNLMVWIQHFAVPLWLQARIIYTDILRFRSGLQDAFKRGENPDILSPEVKGFVLDLNSQGLPRNDISRMTNLSQEEVNKLIDEL